MHSTKDIIGHLALFDPAHLCHDGTYWTWRHPALSLSVLDRFYFEIAARHLPDDGDTFSNDVLHGGFASVGHQWVCWYRWGDGGRDKIGRPGRRVLIAAFIGAADHRGYDAAALLESELVKALLDKARTDCPVSQPPSLEVSWTALECESFERQGEPVQTSQHITLVNQREMSACSAVFASLRDGWNIDCSFHRMGLTASIHIVIAPGWPTTAPPSEALLTSINSDTTGCPAIVEQPKRVSRTIVWRIAVAVLLAVAAVSTVIVWIAQESEKTGQTGSAEYPIQR